MKLNGFEIEILRTLLKSELSDPEIEFLISTSSITGYNFTGVGYFLEISNDRLPIERKVISEPIIIGKTNGTEVSFVLFIENNTLTFECLSNSDKILPENIRTRKLKLEVLDKLD